MLLVIGAFCCFFAVSGACSLVFVPLRGVSGLGSAELMEPFRNG